MIFAPNVRASSLATLLDCPARWEAIHILKFATTPSPQSLLGSAVHAGTEIIDSGGDLDDATHHAQLYVSQSLERQPVQGVDFAELCKQAAVMLASYVEAKPTLPAFDAIEVSCQNTDTGLGFTLSGTIDRVYYTEDASGDRQYGIADIKTGATAVAANGEVNTAKHAFQLGVYQTLYQLETGRELTLPPAIIGIQSAKTSKGARCAVGYLQQSAEELDTMMWGDPETASVGLLKHCSEIIKSERFYPNPSSMLCGPKFCPRHATCKYHG